jgi:hypothetical protein
MCLNKRPPLGYFYWALRRATSSGLKVIPRSSGQEMGHMAQRVNGQNRNLVKKGEVEGQLILGRVR